MEIRDRIRGIARFLRLHWIRSAHRTSDPHLSAIAFGLGVFLGFLPIGAFATLVAALAPRRLGLPAAPAVAGTFTGNWLTAPFIYAASVWTGSLLFTGHPPRWIPPPPQAHWSEHFFSVLRYGPSFLVGILAVSVVAGAIGFAAARAAIPLARRLRSRLRKGGDPRRAKGASAPV